MLKYALLFLLIAAIVAYLIRPDGIIAEGGDFVPRYEQQNGN